MSSGGKKQSGTLAKFFAKFSARGRRWLDECRLAASGVVLATRDRRFLVMFGLTFVIFGTVMQLLSGSTAAVDLFWVVSLSGKLKIIGDAFLGLLGVNQYFWDWALIFGVTLLQSILLGLVVLVWRKRRVNSENLQSAGIAAGLAVLGSGCPTCGTTLLAPVLGTLFSSSSLALAGAISGIITALSVLVALFALKRLGNEAYAMIVSERYMKRKERNERRDDKN